MGICSFSSPQPIGVSFRFRKCKFRNISRNAIQHSAVDIWSGLPAPARDFHRAGSPRLQASRWQIALLGILLEGLSGNRHRLPHQEPSHNRSPAVLRLISGHVLVHCPFREPMPPANVCHLSAAGTPTASWPSAQSGCRCLLRLSATSALRALQPRPGPGTMPTSTPEASWRGEGDIYRPFGTGTLNRTTSGAGSRGKTVWNRCQTGLLPMLRPDFGTATLSADAAVASSRGKAFF